MTQPPPVRPSVSQIPDYVPGRQPEGLDAVKLSSNENPFGPLPTVTAAIAQAGAQCNRYPDMGASALREALAQHHGCAREQVVVGTGSSGVLYALLQALCDSRLDAAGAVGDVSAQQAGQAALSDRDDAPSEVICAWRSFEAYPIATALAGARLVPVPLTEPGHPLGPWHHDLEAMAAAITARTRVVLLCSPNNPTGTVICAQRVRDFLAQIPPHVVVVLDQAYVQFAEDDQSLSEQGTNGQGANEQGANEQGTRDQADNRQPDDSLLPNDSLSQWLSNPQVLILRTFSKAYGLAGLRVGYGLGHQQLVSAITKASVPFGVSAVAQHAALASLDTTAQQELHERVQAVVQQRGHVSTRLRQIFGPSVVADSGANFVWVQLGDHAAAFAQHCLQQGVAVRPFAADAHWPHAGVRVTVGAQAENERLLEAAATFTVSYPCADELASSGWNGRE